MGWLLFIVTVLGPGHLAVEARQFETPRACAEAAREAAQAGPLVIVRCEPERAA